MADSYIQGAKLGEWKFYPTEKTAENIARGDGVYVDAYKVLDIHLQQMNFP